MQIFKCPVSGCNHSCSFGISTGGLPKCPIHNVQVVPADNKQQNNSADVNTASGVKIGGNFNVGGSLHNYASGKIKVSDDGQICVFGDVLNEGDIKVGSDEWKRILLECIKSAGSVAELGAEILKKFVKTV